MCINEVEGQLAIAVQRQAAVILPLRLGCCVSNCGLQAVGKTDRLLQCGANSRKQDEGGPPVRARVRAGWHAGRLT